MPQTAEPATARYHLVAMALHWLIALLIVFEIGLGWRMEGPPGAVTFAVYQLHKSIGITILLLTLARIGWRWTHRPPVPVAGKAWEKALAGAVHIGFYALLLAIPLSGWLIVSASRTGIDTVLFGLLPFPHIPGVPGLEPASRATVEDAAETAHRWLGWALYGLLALHVLGALKHHFVDRDQGLARMIPGSPSVTRIDPRLIAVVVAVAAMVAAAAAYPWTSTGVPTAPAASPARSAEPGPLPVAPTLPEAPAPASAEITPDATTAPIEADPVTPSRWRVRAAESRLTFSTTQSGSPIRGRFREWSADIVFSPEALDRSRVRVTIDMASFATEDADSQGVLGGAEWFDVSGHATATFTADRFRSLGGDRYEARGTLRLKGVSSPATLRFTLTIDGDTARMTGTTTVNRTAFGVGTGEWAGTDDIPADVSVETTVVATRVP